ncbi:MAG: hypothetical protein U0075_09835 [Thermomicrobiales bacterium]
MDTRHFDALGKLLSTSNSRRWLATLMVTLPAAGGMRELLSPVEVKGKRRKKKHKKPTPAPSCTPDPKDQTCAGQCGNVTNNCQQVVDCGACVCDVRCNDIPAVCGAALQAAIDAAAEGDTLIVCPGTYRGGFTIDKALTVIGAGEGNNPARDTILDGNTTQRVLQIPRGTGTVTLRRLRIARGNAGIDGGGGITNSGTRLVMRDCTVADNQGRTGGGVSHDIGALEMTRCTVRDNVAPSVGGGGATGGGLHLTGEATLTDCLVATNASEVLGGGIYIGASYPVILAGTTVVRDNTASQGGGIFADNASLTVGANCRVTHNTANPGNGGGLRQDFSTVTLEGPDPSPIVVDNCHENCVGGVGKCAPGGTCPA